VPWMKMKSEMDLFMNMLLITSFCPVESSLLEVDTLHPIGSQIPYQGKKTAGWHETCGFDRCGWRVVSVSH
jgi:hypothetical protein